MQEILLTTHASLRKSRVLRVTQEPMQNLSLIWPWDSVPPLSLTKSTLQLCRPLPPLFIVTHCGSFTSRIAWHPLRDRSKTCHPCRCQGLQYVEIHGGYHGLTLVTSRDICYVVHNLQTDPEHLVGTLSKMRCLAGVGLKSPLLDTQLLQVKAHAR